MNRQEQIDKICFEFLKWDKKFIRGAWYWASPTDSVESGFDPFTNPADCARVMDEIINRGCTYKIDYDPIDQCWSCELAIEQGVGNVGSFESESDAKMTALLDAIE